MITLIDWFVDWLLLGPLSFGSNKSWRYDVAYNVSAWAYRKKERAS